MLDGQILRIPDKEGLKIPHIGWNSLDLQNNGRLFKGLSEHPYVYFVHSYYLKATDEAIVTATTEYSTHIHASVEKIMCSPASSIRKEQHSRTFDT